MSKYKNKRGVLVFSLSIILIGLLFSACSQAKAEDMNEKIIKKVMELQFNGPDEKFMDVVWNPEYRVVENGVEKNAELDKYAKEVYGDYFTESELDIFMRTFGTSYQSLAHLNGYKLNFKEISIEKSEQTPNRYNFITQVGYQKDDRQEEIAKVEGVILFSTKEEGKIGRFQYENDNGLSENLSK